MPIGLIDDCLFGAPAAGRPVGVGDDVDDTIDGRTWTYVVAINTATEHRTIADRLDLSDIGLDRRTACSTGVGRHRPRRRAIEVELAPA